MSKIVCTKCGKEFSSQEALAQHTRTKHSAKTAYFNLKQKGKIRNWSISVVVAVLIIGSIYFAISNTKTLPPTDIQAHVEENPPSHILKEPMPIAVQKHMLEHADGSGQPGVVINYNCEDYSCEADLIEKLEALAVKYNYVYVAPFPNMDAKIALTRYRKIEILDSYDEKRIEGFITGR